MRAASWVEALSQCEQRGESYVLLTVISIAGSTPREAGAKMVITGDSTYDTIGGGHLEHAATAQARALLASNQQCQQIESFPLSARLGQCCGGAAKLLFEVRVNHTQHITVFGAGHVAQALIPVLAQLPLQISWIDSRASMFTSQPYPPNVKIIVDDDPPGLIRSLPAASWLLILTHNHQLDYDIVETALRHHQFDFVGMIGSDTKARRFTTRLANRGISRAQQRALVSPVGDTRIPGKRPIEVAISISAQIISRLHSTPDAVTKHSATVSASKEEQHDT